MARPRAELAITQGAQLTDQRLPGDADLAEHQSVG
jgi:hypothetical protein